jgi:diguanylate cyclase (GGDEF)-like protein
LDPALGLPALREALGTWGHEVRAGVGEGTVILVADRPRVDLIPPTGRDLLWWIREATPEEVSTVLALRPGWVVRQDQPLGEVRRALDRLRTRDFGTEGWLRRMLHLATLDELLRLVLVRAVELSGASQGAIWVRVDDMFYQRAGEGFAEAPIPRAEAAVLTRQEAAWILCPREQMGLLRLKNPTGDPSQFLGWLPEVESLLLKAWSLERSQELSFKDDLTVAQNRRCLEVELPRAIRDAAARGDCLSLLFLDVDDLKALNSQHGHPTGSRVLTTVAREALRLIRAQDRLYRYGGDEFCIVIRGTAAAGASKLGDRLIRTLMERPMAIGTLQIPISISIGIATYPTHADGAEHLMERADRALFRAKTEGKGRVAIAE